MIEAAARTCLRTIAFFASSLIVACSGDGGTGPGPGGDAPVAVSAPYAALNAVPGSLRTLYVQVTDAQDQGVRDVEVTYTVAPGHGDLESGTTAAATTDGSGVASTQWLLPSVEGQFTVQARATHGGSALAGSPITFSAEVESFSPTVDEMLVPIEQHIASELTRSQQALRANPLLVSYINAKIDMLAAPNLASSIVAGRLFEATTLTSTDARELDLVSVFPRDTMRAGTQQGAAVLAAALPVLEAFMDLPLPWARLRVWYGFSVGSSGGGGSVFSEDRGTFQARMHLIAAPPPYDALFTHELSHSYIGHESLTQFLELLAYNVIAVGSTDPAQWTHKRGYAGPSPANTGIRALLEIRELIGHDAMARAYRAIYPLRPAYGELLTAEVKQRLVDEAPAELKAQVAEKADQIGY